MSFCIYIHTPSLYPVLIISWHKYMKVLHVFLFLLTSNHENEACRSDIHCIKKIMLGFSVVFLFLLVVPKL